MIFIQVHFVNLNMIKRLFYIIFLTIAFLCPIINAQSPDKILKKAVNALGGEKNLKIINSYDLNGSVIRLNDGIIGEFQIQSSSPNFYTRRFEFNGLEYIVAFNGKSGWVRDSKNGLKTLTGEESVDLQEESNYRNNLWLNYKKDKSKLIYSGQSFINGKKADGIIITSRKGVSIKVFFDSASGLPIREEIPFGEFTNTFDYSDFRLVDGIKEPFLISATIQNEKYELKLDSIKHNPQISRANFDFPQISNEPLPDIPTLLKELRANEDRVDDILENYTFKQTNTMRELGKDGIVRDKESETYQLTFYKGYRIRRLIAKDGKALTSDQQEKEDKDVQKRITEIEKEIAKKEAKAVRQTSSGTPDEENKRISIAEVLRASNLINPRREQFRGRDVIVFDFEPNPDFDFKNAKSFLKFFGKTAGVMWIDAQDKQVARLEAVLFDSYKVGGGFLANLKKGAAFTLENDRINNEVWLPSSADINLSIKVLLVKGININQNIKYSDYEKFNTEIKDSNIDEVGKPD